MWIEIFKTGTHTDSNGRSCEYTAEDIAVIADTYNSKILDNPSLKAPVVKGHPLTNEPAYGWVDRLARRGEKLMADVNELNTEIVGQIKQGMYRKVSISLYADKMLRHVGLLGAGVPAVKGLADVRFEDGEDIVQFVYEEQSEGKDTEFEDISNENEMLKAELAAIRKETRLKEFREYTERFISSDGGNITPAQSSLIVDMLELAYEKDATMEMDYTESNSYTGRIREFIETLKPVVSLVEFASKSQANTERRNRFAGQNTAPERLKLHELAVEMQNQHPGLSYEEAVIKVTK